MCGFIFKVMGLVLHTKLVTLHKKTPQLFQAMDEKVNESQRESGRFITTSVMMHDGAEWRINQRDIQQKRMGN